MFLQHTFSPLKTSLSTHWALLLCLCLSPSLGLASDNITALVAGRIIDGRHSKALSNTVILTKDNKILAIGNREIIPENALVIDLGDATLLPGLIDTHIHPLMHGDDYQARHLETSSAYKTLKAFKSTQALLRAGWTSLRVMGTNDVFYGFRDLRRVYDEGLFVGPRITGAGHYLSITGGGGDINYLSPEQSVHADGLIVDGPEEVRKAIRREVKYGSDWIKLLVTGAFMSVGDNPRNVAFSAEELQVAMDEAKRLNVPVAAHAHATEGINMAVRAGARSIEHGTYLDDESIRLMKKHGTFLVPTIYVGDYYADESQALRAQDKNDHYSNNIRSTFLRQVGKAHKAGVKIAVGLDLGGEQYNPTFSARELAVLIEAGMSPMEAVQAATRVGAELLGWDHKLGTLAPGMLADIIAVAGNPLKDISELERVNFVMIDGKVVKQP